MTAMFLICVCVAVGVTFGQDTDGFFLLAGTDEKTVYKLENESFSTIPVSTDIHAMAFDPMSRRVYYGSVYSIHLYSMKLDATDIRVEATTDLYVQAIAVDSVAGNIFVYSPGKGKIYRVVMREDPTLDQNDIIHTGEGEVFSMDVDPKTRTLFWGSKAGVWQSNYDGTSKKNMLSLFDYVNGISVDDQNVYVIINNKILKIDRSHDQTYTEIFGDIGDSSTAESLVLVGTSLYFSIAACVYRPTTMCNTSIATVHIDGTGFKHLGPVLSSINYGDTLTLVYILKSKDTTTTTTRLTSTTTTGSTPTIMTSSPVGTMEATDTDGFFLLAGTDEKTVYKLENESFSTIPVSTDIHAMAFDPMSRRVYYGSVYSIHLYSMKLDATDIRVEATTDLYVQAIAVDSVAGNIFVYSPGKGKIYRVVMREDPTLDQNDIIHTGEGEVFSMDVDPKTRTLFWGSKAGVWQSNYDGTSKKNMLSLFDYVNGISVDDQNVYVIINNKILKIDRSHDQTYTEIFGDIGDSSTAESLVLVGTSLYFSIAACVYRPTTMCNTSIATVHIDGTGFKHLGPVLSSINYGDTLTLVYILKSKDTTTTTTRLTSTTTTGSTPTIMTSSPVGTMEATDTDGFFLLAGTDEKTVYKLENESFSTIPVSTDIHAMAFDPMSRRVYYGSVYSIHLYSMKLDATDIRVEATTDLYVQAIAVDSVAGNIFVYSPGKGKIYRVVMREDPTLDQNDIIHTGEGEVFSMDVDPKTRTLFWGSKAGVWQSNYDGTSKKNMLSLFDYVNGISVDDQNVYVIINNKILKIDRSHDQTYTEIFGDIGDSSTAESLVLVGTSLYFSIAACVYRPTTMCNTSIATVHIDGTGFKHLGPVLSSINYGDTLTLVYILKSKDTTTTTTRLTSTTTTGSTPTIMTSSPVGTMEATVVDGQFLLAGAVEKTVYMLEKESFSTIDVVTDIHTMAFDPMSRRVYYGSIYSIHLYSMKLDGTDVRVEATTDLYVQAIAIDSVAGNIFVYSPGNTGKIFRVEMGEDPTFDQSNIIHTGEREVFYMAVDPKTRTLFWGSTTGVWQSSYDGTNKKNILSVFGYFDGIAVDDRYVYGISTSKVFKIDRSMDQTFTEIYTIGEPRRAKGLVVVGNSLYFSSSKCVNSHATVCTSSVDTVLIDGTGCQRVSPVVSLDNNGYRLTLIYLTGSNAKMTTASPVLTKSLVIVLLIVSLVVALVIAIAVILSCKRISGKGQPVGEPTYESPYNFDSISHIYEDPICNSDVVVKFDDSEKQKLEKMYREIDAKGQINGHVGPPKKC
ncbi:uncharacterized protein LOC117329370 [Pecten maximus]|uniref:uncharacterized protein LOC117329370 n=1 Tax=Pecten maximus TaxID=6579 RepID=UPI001458FF50|nr:uncharacterized protein LOC117329370 [Pecten maximus]